MASAHQHTDKTPEETTERIWELAESIRTCMLTTWDGESQRARPMSARVRRDEHAIYFLDDVRSAKEAQIEQFPRVLLSFADTGSNKYVAIAGAATVSNDRNKIAELWSDFDKAWWNSQSDPSIRLITVMPHDAELWDSVNKLVATAKMLTAAVTGVKPVMGDNAKVVL